jgi:hypothetical protein
MMYLYYYFYRYFPVGKPTEKLVLHFFCQVCYFAIGFAPTEKFDFPVVSISIICTLSSTVIRCTLFRGLLLSINLVLIFVSFMGHKVITI